MNEGERCDRISLMHAGRVLAIGPAQELTKRRGMATLEDAFIAYLEEAGAREPGAKPMETPVSTVAGPAVSSAPPSRRFDRRRLWAYARREAMEILRDPIRLTFALLGPVILMLVTGYGISFDVEHLAYAAFDQDQTRESRELLENFSGSRYFQEHPEIFSDAELQRRLQNGELKLVIEIPPDFGADVTADKQTAVSAWIDGAMPFQAETTRSYLAGIMQAYAADQAARGHVPPLSQPVNMETRFRYNPAFKSVYSIVPGVIMLILMMIPTMLTAVGVVREKESGSIANFRSTPVTKIEFLLGKQLPYAMIALASFASLLVLAATIFGVPVRGSLAALITGVICYVAASTGFGLLISTFTSTQVAAIFAAGVLTVIPCVNFSGLLVPVGTLSGVAYMTGLGFPAAWFNQVSLGTFTKGLGFADLWPDLLILALFAVGLVLAATLALRKQEA
jgi:ribosome-dependent ATPase